MQLSSRQTQTDQIDSLERLREVVENSDVQIHIIEDRTIDPPVTKIKVEDDSNSELLILKHADDRFTLYDVIKILDRLGYVTDYEELK